MHLAEVDADPGTDLDTFLAAEIGQSFQVAESVGDRFGRQLEEQQEAIVELVDL